MLFSSQPFLFLFLPLALILWHASASSRSLRLAALLGASLFFYAWWDPRFLPLLVAVIGFNWCVSRLYLRWRRPALLTLGVIGNLAVLGLFKYANFFAENVLELMGVPHTAWTIVLPLGISFFTFQQISYLVDLRRGDAEGYPLLDYAAYVAFFPQLIAGPIVRHHQLIGQFDADPRRDGVTALAARGLLLFTLGLIKKVFFADGLAPIADAGFDAAAAGSAITGSEAWLAALAYSLQLYFDFSAYSDMALGLAALFGFTLPLNFDAPYKARDIRDFWRRWHISLSQFLRDYVYIPLGGSRSGLAATCFAVMGTMLLCGLWHGAGWTFIAWGALHGLAICANRAWLLQPWRMPAALGWLLTIVFAIFGWVLFRAPDFATASHMLMAMLGGGAPGSLPDPELTWFVAVLAVLAVAGPTNDTCARHPAVLTRRVARPLAVAAGLALFAVALRAGQPVQPEFIYFQF